jgi:hypothetical protein
MTAVRYIKAFPSKINLMRLHPRGMLTKKLGICNYRLSRARKSVECSFVILNAKFKIFEGPIHCKEETVNSAIKSSISLQNFIRIGEGLF